MGVLSGWSRPPYALVLACTWTCAACTAACSSPAAPSPSTDALWYGGTALCGLSLRQLGAGADGGNVAPHTVLTTPSLAAILDVAFDAQGRPWVVGAGTNDVLRFPASAIGASGDVEPDLVIRSAALQNPGNLAFDADGALWVANRPSNSTASVDGSADGAIDGTLLRFSVPTGTSGVEPLDPTLQITSAVVGDLYQIGMIGFDSAHNLWATSFAGLVRFDDPRALTGSVSLSADALIDKTGYNDDFYFYSIAFDRSGALWSATGDGLHHLTSLTKFQNPAAIIGRSSPAADAMITGGLDLLPAGGIAFDSAANLWIATGESLLMYEDPSALLGTVNPDPARVLGLLGPASPTTNSHLVFLPTATGAAKDGGQD